TNAAFVGSSTTLPNPPTVLTGTAASVTQTTATLAASVNSNGGNVTECRFEYGTSPSYGASAPCASLPGSATSPVEVSAQISGLKATTTYPLPLHAALPISTSAAFVGSSTTLPNPPTVLTGTAASVTQT